MKKTTPLLLPVLLILFVGTVSSSLHAQSFFGYQTIGVHTWYVSLSWDGKPNLGAGYNFRNFGGNAFTDIGAEWRFPVDEMWKFDNHEIIAGFYRPLRLRRWFAAAGLHGSYKANALSSGKQEQIGVSATLIPSYAYAASTGDGPYGTAGIILGYDAVLAEKHTTHAEDWELITRHGVRIGGHLDLHLERTLGLSTNGFFSREWQLKELEYADDDADWQGEGELYLGATYYLRRW